MTPPHGSAADCDCYIDESQWNSIHNRSAKLTNKGDRTQTDRGSSRCVTTRCSGGIDSDWPAPVVREDAIQLALASASQIEASPSQLNAAVSKTPYQYWTPISVGGHTSGGSTTQCELVTRCVSTLPISTHQIESMIEQYVYIRIFIFQSIEVHLKENYWEQRTVFVDLAVRLRTIHPNTGMTHETPLNADYSAMAQPASVRLDCSL